MCVNIKFITRSFFFPARCFLIAPLNAALDTALCVRTNIFFLFLATIKASTSKIKYFVPSLMDANITLSKRGMRFVQPRRGRSRGWRSPLCTFGSQGSRGTQKRIENSPRIKLSRGEGRVPCILENIPCSRRSFVCVRVFARVYVRRTHRRCGAACGRAKF